MSVQHTTPASQAARRTASKALATLILAALAGTAQAQSLGNVQAYLQCRHATISKFPGTIVDAAVATPALSTLVSLVQAADLVGTLSGKGPFTVYAPTNEAFGKVPTPLLDLLGSDTALLTSVLTYHVTPGVTDPRRAITPTQAKTVQGQSVFYSYGKSGLQINQSGASCQGIQTTNGIVWVIDSVLLPQFK
jgi:uncharacterized surface protein with fasciclin (FAS1) repeats